VCFEFEHIPLTTCHFLKNDIIDCLSGAKLTKNPTSVWAGVSKITSGFRFNSAIPALYLQLNDYSLHLLQQDKYMHWIGLCSVLRPRQHSISYMGDGFYRSKDPTNSIKVLKEMLQKTNQTMKTTKYTYAQTKRICTK